MGINKINPFTENFFARMLPFVLSGFLFLFALQEFFRVDSCYEGFLPSLLHSYTELCENTKIGLIINVTLIVSAFFISLAGFQRSSKAVKILALISAFIQFIYYLTSYVANYFILTYGAKLTQHIMPILFLIGIIYVGYIALKNFRKTS